MGFVNDLKKMKMQGATTIAAESMRHLVVFSRKHGFGRAFDAECRKLLAARPTAVPLYNAVTRVRDKRNEKEMKNIIAELKTAKEKAAENSSRLFYQSVVLTHCHSTFEVAAMVKNRRNIRKVFVTETRPKNQGVITARELAAARIPVAFIVDSAVASYIDGADMVIVGADALRKEGVVNKVGTHLIAHEAKEHGKPFYVITSSFSIDRRKRFRMEQRPASELPRIRGAKILNPAFDITPWKYVTAVVTEKGLLKPGKIKGLFR